MYLKSDGALIAIGNNFYGQLGDGTTEERSVPITVDQEVAAISTGEFHSFYLKSEGNKMAMGRNESGQLGDGSNTGRLTPFAIGEGVRAISAGVNYSLHIKSIDYATWEKQQFTEEELQNIEISGYEADPDRDGLSNFFEY